MRELTSFLEAATEFGLRAAEVGFVLHESLEHVMEKIEKTAAASIGTYQPAVGGFVGWAPLSEVTLERKAARGFAVPMPLLETGAMLASFGHEVRGLEGAAGATDPKAIYFETGTSRMPPRPVWGPAAFNNREAIREMLGAALAAGIGGRRLPQRDGGAGAYRYQIRL